MEKSIYNVVVPMESQKQCDRMLQICIENELPYWKNKEAFEFMNIFNNYFTQSDEDDDFLIWVDATGNRAIKDKYQISEEEFIELLKQHKNA